MFVEKIDWMHPQFKRWNINNLGPLNEAQRNAFYDDDVSYSRK